MQNSLAYSAPVIPVRWTLNRHGHWSPTPLGSSQDHCEFSERAHENQPTILIGLKQVCWSAYSTVKAWHEHFMSRALYQPVPCTFKQ